MNRLFVAHHLCQSRGFSKIKKSHPEGWLFHDRMEIRLLFYDHFCGAIGAIGEQHGVISSCQWSKVKHNSIDSFNSSVVVADDYATSDINDLNRGVCVFGSGELKIQFVGQVQLTL